MRTSTSWTSRAEVGYMWLCRTHIARRARREVPLHAALLRPENVYSFRPRATAVKPTRNDGDEVADGEGG